MVDRYEKNRERMQQKQAEHAAEEQTEQSEPAQEKTEPTDTDVLEKALKGKEKKQASSVAAISYPRSYCNR